LPLSFPLFPFRLRPFCLSNTPRLHIRRWR
jgi:hypothetical protein